MSLTERLTKPPVPPNKQFCTVGKLLADLAARGVGGALEEHRALVGALTDPAWSSTMIKQALADEGHDVSIKHLREHRSNTHTNANCRAPRAGVITEFSGS